MSFTSINASDVLSALNKETLLITASPRLVTEWKRHLFLNISEKVMATPTIYFWDEWLIHLSGQSVESPIPLTNTQELLLWEKVIRNNLNTGSNSRHTSLKGLARRASEAYTLMQAYGMDTTELALGGEEAEALAVWINVMKAELETSQLKQRVLMADIPSLTCLALPELGTPECIILDGFEIFTPLQLQLLDQLKEKGCYILTIQSEQTPAVPTLTPYPDELSELRHVASHIQSLLDKNPLIRISILTSDSFSDKAALRRELDKVLMPESIIDPACDQQAVSMQGDPLPNWPMIEQTMHLLSMAGKRGISFSDFSLLLLSPWVKGFKEEQMARAILDARFRRQNRHHLSLKSLLNLSDVASLPAFHAVVKAVNGWTTSSRPASQWVKAIHTLLQATGMVQTGLKDEYLRSNIEIRQINAFRDALTSLASADAIHTNMTWAQFLSILHTVCSDTRLALTTRYPNINVMPLSQVSGLTFDHIFVLAMDEQSLPAAARPQPLLPLSLQKKYDIPMSHGALQFESAQWLWQQLLQAAPYIEISYAEQQGEREVQPSSFVKALSIMPPADITVIEQSFEMETYIDAVNIPLKADEKVHGGTAIIKNQSACPFRAFITHRLAVTALGDTEPGIEATTKGSLIHAALEFIWNQLKSQSALLALSEDGLNELIRTAVEHAWQKRRSSHNVSVQKFEKKRMARLLAEWLDMESKRPPFKVISTEKPYLLKLPEQSPQQLPLHMSADRIDQDDRGKQILIDYKTGAKQSPSKWLGERMEQPQLPLYALAAELTEHDAVCFATVRTGHEMGFEGLAGEDTGINGIAICDGKRGHPDDWQQVLGEWKGTLNILAEEFMNGRSEVAPRNSTACVHCGLESLCRIEETGFDMESEDTS